jgi:hypothetical protein
MMRTRAATTLYILYAATVLFAFIRGGWASFAFNSGVLVALTAVVILTYRNERYALLSCALTLLFLIPLFASLFFGYQMHSSILGEDKLFHAIGGALLAWFAFITLEDYMPNTFVLAASIIFFAAAVGGWWEVYEWMLAALRGRLAELTLTDSMLDIVADTIGAFVCAAVLVLRTEKKKRKSKA